MWLMSVERVRLLKDPVGCSGVAIGTRDWRCCALNVCKPQHNLSAQNSRVQAEYCRRLGEQRINKRAGGMSVGSANWTN